MYHRCREITAGFFAVLLLTIITPPVGWMRAHRHSDMPSNRGGLPKDDWIGYTFRLSISMLLCMFVYSWVKIGFAPFNLLSLGWSRMHRVSLLQPLCLYYTHTTYIQKHTHVSKITKLLFLYNVFLWIKYCMPILYFFHLLPFVGAYI